MSSFTATATCVRACTVVRLDAGRGVTDATDAARVWFGGRRCKASNLVVSGCPNCDLELVSGCAPALLLKY